jgi:hypothetical protein
MSWSSSAVISTAGCGVGVGDGVAVGVGVAVLVGDGGVVGVEVGVAVGVVVGVAVGAVVALGSAPGGEVGSVRPLSGLVVQPAKSNSATSARQRAEAAGPRLLVVCLTRLRARATGRMF